MRWLLLVVLAFVGCTNEEGARHALEVSGFTQIVITGHDMFGCSKDDGTCTGFRAIGPSGLPVTGAVGCGIWGKGCTIRIK